MAVYMEDLLKNISANKTFSVRNPKKFKDNDYIDDDLDDSRGLVLKPNFPRELQNKPQKSSIGDELGGNIKSAYPAVFDYGKHSNRLTFPEFIELDRNVYSQRKILLRQEKLQKITAATWVAASNTKKLNTKGLQLEDVLENSSKGEDGVTTWPQYESEAVWKLEKYYEKRDEKRRAGMRRKNRFWTALFPEQEGSKTNNNSRKSRIFPDPAYILHLALLKVKDERELEAVNVLKLKLVSLNVLRKTNLRAMVNELFLRALDKGYDNLVQLLIESGFPENINHSIYGEGKSRRFPSYLLLAIGLGRLKIVQKMLESQPRAQLNRGWFNGIRPLMLAQMTRKVSGQSLIMTHLLLKHGAESNRSISYSTYLNGLSFLNQMRERPCNRSKTLQASKLQRKGSRTPRGRRKIYQNSRLFALDFAIYREKFESVHLILQSKNYSTWLARNEFCLLRLEDFETAADILQRCPDLINQRDPRGNTPLHWVSKLGRADMVGLYLKYTKKVDVLNYHHWTPLHEAAAGAHRATVQYLISRGADCSIKNIEGKTALQVARENGISSEELYEFFHSTDTIQRTQQLIGQQIIPKMTETIPDKTGSRLLIQKLMKYPRKLWDRSFK